MKGFLGLLFKERHLVSVMIFGVMYGHTFLNFQITRSDIRPHTNQVGFSLVTACGHLIFLRVLYGYLWVKILTLSSPPRIGDIIGREIPNKNTNPIISSPSQTVILFLVDLEDNTNVGVVGLLPGVVWDQKNTNPVISSPSQTVILFLVDLEDNTNVGVVGLLPWGGMGSD